MRDCILDSKSDCTIDYRAPKSSFIPVTSRQMHPLRRRAILLAHPDAQSLIGHDPRTAALAVAVAFGQVATAAFLGHLGFAYWWLALGLAFCVGAFANHALLIIIHDAAHNCIFERPFWNRWIAILADLPNTFPTAIAFRCYHLQHHSRLGDYDYDADLPSRWETEHLGRTWVGKALWLFLFPALQLVRLGRLKGTVPIGSRWTFVDIVCVLAFNLFVLGFLGPNALLYLFASFWFSLGGLHPLGGRLLQEHFTTDPAQETFDYYGALNLVALNAGYHNEHHDFPDVPWSRLPQLKSIAPEFYDGLYAYRSWSELLHQFIFDPRCSLDHRVDRRAAATGPHVEAADDFSRPARGLA
jgi:sphingolipid delta-4 desaturase